MLNGQHDFICDSITGYSIADYDLVMINHARVESNPAFVNLSEIFFFEFSFTGI